MHSILLLQALLEALRLLERLELGETLLGKDERQGSQGLGLRFQLVILFSFLSLKK